MTSWRELIVDVDDRYATALADVFVEQGAAGAVIEDDETRALPGSRIEPTHRARISASFEAYAGLEARVAAAISRFVQPLDQAPQLQLSWNDIEQRDWAEVWKQNWKPMHITPHIVIVPSWEQYAPQASEKTISMDPGMAFGTGTHETTQLCALALERFCKAGTQLLDVGCGTGILAFVGALLGASRVLAIDNDADAVQVARDNAHINQLDSLIDFVVSNNVAVDGLFDVVVANILKEPLIALGHVIAARLAPHGTLLLSGLLIEQLDAVSEAYHALGLQECSRQVQGEWGLLELAFKHNR